MILKIKGEEYRVKFGVGFVRELDKNYCTQTQNGMKFGFGLETQIPKLLTGDLVALAEFLYIGTCAEEKRPELRLFDEYIDNMDMKDVEVLFDSVVEELRRSNATMKKLGEFEKALKEEEEKLKKQKETQKKSTRK